MERSRNICKNTNVLCETVFTAGYSEFHFAWKFSHELFISSSHNFTVAAILTHCAIHSVFP